MDDKKKIITKKEYLEECAKTREPKPKVEAPKTIYRGTRCPSI